MTPSMRGCGDRQGRCLRCSWWALWQHAQVLVGGHTPHNLYAYGDALGQPYFMVSTALRQCAALLAGRRRPAFQPAGSVCASYACANVCTLVYCVYAHAGYAAAIERSQLQALAASKPQQTPSWDTFTRQIDKAKAGHETVKPFLFAGGVCMCSIALVPTGMHTGQAIFDDSEVLNAKPRRDGA